MDTQDSSQTLDEKDSASSSFSAESRSFPHPSSNAPEPQSSTASYLAYPVAHVVSGLYRRLTEPSIPPSNPPPMRNMHYRSQDDTSGIGNVYTPPGRTASPFQPPPLTPLTLRGIHSSTPLSAQILTRSLGEEIRLLVPPRLQLVADWTLVYSVEQDGTSLGTLYKKCEEFSGGNNNGFVLVVRDSVGGIFGAFLTDRPHPSFHYYGTGECFLWRASVLPMSSILASLPPPPSADTTNLQRSTTIASRPKILSSKTKNGHARSSGTSTPERIRFKAFLYSGVNDYIIFCEHRYLSVGGGDGRYGLWLDGVLERGVSSRCLTFGNEGLSEEGEKFDVQGVEVWYIGTSETD